MGLEPLFDAGRQVPKYEGCYLICSDAGAPLSPGFNMGPLNVFRLKRVADIMSDQSRSLHVRTLMQYIRQTPSSGAYLEHQYASFVEQELPICRVRCLIPDNLAPCAPRRV